MFGSTLYAPPLKFGETCLQYAIGDKRGEVAEPIHSLTLNHALAVEFLERNADKREAEGSNRAELEHQKK